MDLSIFIKARYPIISVASHEEQRVEATVLAIAHAAKTTKAVWVWTCSDGMRQISGDAIRQRTCKSCHRPGLPTITDGVETCPFCKGKAFAEREADNIWTFPAKKDTAGVSLNQDETEEPAAALRLIREWPGEMPTLFIFKGLRQLILDAQGGISAPVVVRLLKDVANEFPVNGKKNTLILVDPDSITHGDLSKDIAVYDWPFPTRAELSSMIDNTSEDCEIQANFTLEGRDELLRALAGLTEGEANKVLASAVVSTKRFDESAIQFVIEEKAQTVKKSGFLTYIPTCTKDEEIGGVENAKRYMSDVRATCTSEAEAYGADRVRAVLLTGIPGTGKSLMSRAFAGASMILLDCNMGDALGKYVGDTEHNTKLIFKTASALAPCVLRMDEVDKVFGNVDSADGDNGAKKAIFGKTLTFIQESPAPILTVATANWPDQLPPEFVSRFDKVIFFDAPNATERAEILAIHLAKRGRKPSDFDLQLIASITDGYVGRELERVVSFAIRRGLVDGRRVVDTADLRYVIDKRDVRPLCEIMPEKIAKIKAWGAMHGWSASDPEDVQATPVIKSGKREIEVN